MTEADRRRNMRALVVDDHEENVYLLRALLGASGYDVDSAQNGREALECAARHRPDIIISDILMPVMDGFTLCRRWRSDPELRAIPFVFYTGTYTDPEDERLALSIGADLFIVKPTEPDPFLELVAEVLEKKRRGELTPGSRPGQSEEVPYLREYNAALIRKLEDKLAELEEANSRLALRASVMDAAVSGTALYSPSGECSYVNRSFAVLRGKPREALLGSSLKDLFADPALTTTILRILDERGVWIGEAEIERGDGTRPWLSGVVQRVRAEDGQLACTVVSCVDITEQKRAALELQRAQRLEALSLFSRGVAHDFNNLLSGFFGNVDLARRQLPEGSPASEYLDNALRAFERARSLTTRLLGFARGSAPARAEVDVAELLSECCALSLSGSGVAHELTAPPELWAAVGDSSQLSQVCNNIIINAREAMEGHGTLRVTLGNRVVGEGELAGLSAGEYVEAIFRDEGHGIPEGTLESIFEPTYTTKARGSGLGLASSRAIVKEHGGHVSARPAPGAGAEFQLLLPRARGEASSHPPEVRPASAGGSGRILVMDDEPLVSETVRNILRSAGYEVVDVSNGADAIEAFDREAARGTPFDLAMLDVTVRGGMGGLDAMAILRRRVPTLSILLTSGYPDERVSRAADERQVEFIAKPYRRQELVSRVSRMLAGRQR